MESVRLDLPPRDWYISAAPPRKLGKAQRSKKTKAKMVVSFSEARKMISDRQKKICQSRKKEGEAFDWHLEFSPRGRGNVLPVPAWYIMRRSG